MVEEERQDFSTMTADNTYLDIMAGMEFPGGYPGWTGLVSVVAMEYSAEHAVRAMRRTITILPEGDLAGNKMLEMEIREKRGGEFTDDEAHMHKHPWVVVYIVLDGEGYSNLQREGEPKRVLSWKKGDM